MSKNILKFMNNTIQLKNNIDSFYDLLGDSTSVFRIILDLYLKAGMTPSKEDEIQIELRFEQLSKIELTADELRRNIESILYEKKGCNLYLGQCYIFRNVLSFPGFA